MDFFFWLTGLHTVTSSAPALGLSARCRLPVHGRCSPSLSSNFMQHSHQYPITDMDQLLLVFGSCQDHAALGVRWRKSLSIIHSE